MSKRLPRQTIPCVICGNTFEQIIYPVNSKKRTRLCCSGECGRQLSAKNSMKTKIERYGSLSYNNSDKRKSTSLEKYGHGCSLFGKEQKEKTRQTNLRKYGAENVLCGDSSVRDTYEIKDFRNSETQAKAQKRWHENIPEAFSGPGKYNPSQFVNGKRVSRNQVALFEYLSNRYPHILIEINSPIKVDHAYGGTYWADIFLPEYNLDIELNETGSNIYSGHDFQSYKNDEENGTENSPEMRRQRRIESKGYNVRHIWADNLKDIKRLAISIVGEYTNFYYGEIDRCEYIILEDGTHDPIISREYIGEEEVYDIAVDRNCNFILENGAVVHNSRAGGQVPFSSINLGTDTSYGGRLITEGILTELQKGLGHGEICIFPIVIFKLKDGLSALPGDPNYDLYRLALKSAATRLYPTFLFLDAPFNLVYQDGNPIHDIALMGCRTRLAANYHNPSMNGQSLGRGNISFITINLPYLALEAARWCVGSNLVRDLRNYLKEDRYPEALEKFKELLYEYLDVCAELLLHRLNIVGQRPISSQQMMMMNGIWTAKSLGRPLDLDEIPEDELRNLCPDFSGDRPIEDVYEFAYLNNKLPRVPYKPSDKQLEIIKDGSLSIGFCGLAECLYVLCGNHHGETEEAQELGLEIVGIMNDYCIERSEKERLNYSLFASPAESTASRFAEAIVKEFGYIEGIVQKEEGSTDYYITNSNHIPVNFPISISRKIDLEAPYHALCSAGDICYVELDGDASNNIDTLERIVNYMKESGVGYGAINVPVDEDPVCGYVGVIDKVCPRCGRCVPN